MATPAFLEPEIGDVGMSSDREHHQFGGDARAVGKVGGEFLAVLVDLADRAARENRDAPPLHLGADMGAHVIVEAAQDVVAAIDHGHIGAEARENAAELQRDVAATLDHDTLGQFRQVERLIRRNHMVDAGDRRPMIGRASGRDHDVFCLHGFAVGEAKRVGVFENRAGLEHARAGFLDIGGVDALEPGDLLVLVGDQRLPVEGHRRNGPAEAGGVLDFIVDVRSDHEQLFRHAAADHAGAAHPVLFGHHDAGAVAGRDPGGANTARASADDKQIDVEFSHLSPDPDRNP